MTEDPFGFVAAINWDAVDEHADEIAAIFDPVSRNSPTGPIEERLLAEIETAEE